MEMIETAYRNEPKSRKFNPDGLSDLPDDGLAPQRRLLDAGDGDCRWPGAISPKGELMCCGRARSRGKSYCEEHEKRARPKNAGGNPFVKFDRPPFMPLSLERLGL